MLLIFKSKAAADVIMLEVHAKRILNLLHKDSQIGVITAAETSDAVILIEQEINNSKNHQASEAIQHDIQAHHKGDEHDHGHENIDKVSFASRAYPLLDMLRAAQKGNHDVRWGF